MTEFAKSLQQVKAASEAIDIMSLVEGEQYNVDAELGDQAAAQITQIRMAELTGMSRMVGWILGEENFETKHIDEIIKKAGERLRAADKMVGVAPTLLRQMKGE